MSYLPGALLMSWSPFLYPVRPNTPLQSLAIALQKQTRRGTVTLSSKCSRSMFPEWFPLSLLAVHALPCELPASAKGRAAPAIRDRKETGKDDQRRKIKKENSFKRCKLKMLLVNYQHQCLLVSRARSYAKSMRAFRNVFIPKPLHMFGGCWV